MRVFVTGVEGQVARSIGEAAARSPDIVVGHGARPAFDLTRPETVWPAIEAFAPDVVINAAAYTAVDRAEAEPDLAFAINRDGAAAVATAAARLGVPVIQLSTDYVFCGDKQSAYLESDPVSPQGVYGRSKLEGEQAVATANPQHLIARTSWVYAPFGSNFVRTMLRLAGDRDRLGVVDDQIGCPTYAPDIAAALLAIAGLWRRQGWRDEHAGVTNIAGPDAVSWCDFARRIIAGAAQRGFRDVAVDAITTAQYPTPAKRPANSVLSTARLEDTFALKLPRLDTSLNDCLGRLIENRATTSAASTTARSRRRGSCSG